ncbi:MAG: hypothetical protein ACRC7O_11435 [Fimbriiglobus sp.]
MAYGDFTLVGVETAFGLRSEIAPLFPGLSAAPVPDWLRDQLARGLEIPLLTEKVRGELLVMPVLLAAREQALRTVTVYSGVRLDVDASRGLTGECDFVLGRAIALPEVRAPIMTLVEAKRDFIEAGLGQCAAQMIGARVFNEQGGSSVPVLFGCVTTGERWQFLRLTGPTLTVDTVRYSLDNLPGILGVFHAILAPPEPR